MRSLLEEKDDYLKRDVIELIGKSGSRDDLALIQPMCNDNSFTVSYAAKQAVQNLEKLAEKSEELEDNEPVSEKVVDVLFEIFFC